MKVIRYVVVKGKQMYSLPMKFVDASRKYNLLKKKVKGLRIKKVTINKL